jgi:hypothetical protein
VSTRTAADSALRVVAPAAGQLLVDTSPGLDDPLLALSDEELDSRRKSSQGASSSRSAGEAATPSPRAGARREPKPGPALNGTHPHSAANEPPAQWPDNSAAAHPTTGLQVPSPAPARPGHAPAPSPTAAPPAQPGVPAPRAISFPAFPPAPRPSGPALVAPSAPVAVPAAAAALYASSVLAGNLSSMQASVDVLLPQLDVLELEPPSGGGDGTSQRVYRSSSSPAAAPGNAGAGPGSAGAGAAGAAAGPGSGAGAVGAGTVVRRKRVRLKRSDAGELLLARDEAMRSELLGRTWQELLQFEARVDGAGGGAPSGSAGRVAPADEVPSLEVLLQAMRGPAEAAAAAPQQPRPQLPLRAGLAAGNTVARREVLRLLRGSGSWPHLRRLLAKFGPDMAPEHLAAALGRLAALRAQQLRWQQVGWGVRLRVLQADGCERPLGAAPRALTAARCPQAHRSVPAQTRLRTLPSTHAGMESRLSPLRRVPPLLCRVAPPRRHRSPRRRPPTAPAASCWPQRRICCSAPPLPRRTWPGPRRWRCWRPCNRYGWVGCPSSCLACGPWL